MEAEIQRAPAFERTGMRNRLALSKRALDSTMTRMNQLTRQISDLDVRSPLPSLSAQLGPRFMMMYLSAGYGVGSKVTAHARNEITTASLRECAPVSSNS